MNKTSTIVGLVITVIYIPCICIITWGRFGQIYTMGLNELGDFFAGIFGPLAILWLILGYIQQGRELQQSTKALELQAQELINSVQQQKELVEVSKKQVEAEREVLQYERQKQIDSAKPVFTFSKVGSSHDGSTKSIFATNASNVGGTITQIKFTKTGNQFTLTDTQSWETNRTFKLQWVYIKNMPIEENFKIQFTDRLGNPGKSQYKIVVNTRNTPPTAEIF